MKEKTSLGGSLTFAGTSLTIHVGVIIDELDRFAITWGYRPFPSAATPDVTRWSAY